MKLLKGLAAGLFCILFLGGCAGRELEDREFPSVITVPIENIQSLQEMRQKKSEKYLDYSHTKAVILKETVAEDPEKLGEVLKYFETRPEFARNMLVFIGDEEALELAVKKKDKEGISLQDFYKNQPKGLEEQSVTLGDLLNFKNNEEEEILVPRVNAAGEHLLPGKTVRLTN